MTALIDVNVLFAIINDDHEHTTVAKNWLEDHADNIEIRICRIAEMGVLRLLTAKSTMGDDRLTPMAAWETVQTLLREDDRFQRIGEPPRLESHWESILSSLDPKSAASTDTYLAAFALAANLALLTFDTGFRRFPKLKVEILSSA